MGKEERGEDGCKNIEFGWEVLEFMKSGSDYIWDALKFMKNVIILGGRFRNS